MILLPIGYLVDTYCQKNSKSSHFDTKRSYAIFERSSNALIGFIAGGLGYSYTRDYSGENYWDLFKVVLSREYSTCEEEYALKWNRNCDKTWEISRYGGESKYLFIINTKTLQTIDFYCRPMTMVIETKPLQIEVIDPILFYDTMQKFGFWKGNPLVVAPTWNTIKYTSIGKELMSNILRIRFKFGEVQHEMPGEINELFTRDHPDGFFIKTSSEAYKLLTNCLGSYKNPLKQCTLLDENWVYMFCEDPKFKINAYESEKLIELSFIEE